MLLLATLLIILGTIFLRCVKFVQPVAIIYMIYSVFFTGVPHVISFLVYTVLYSVGTAIILWLLGIFLMGMAAGCVETKR